jgi:thymidylate synthase
MFFSESTLDDLLYVVYETMKDLPFNGNPTRSKSHGKTAEMIGVKLILLKPTARLSRSIDRGLIFSRLGELLWYLSGSNELKFIQYYLSHYKKESEDGKIIYGGYGTRLFNKDGSINQIENVIELLKNNPETRRAVIQIFDAKDINEQHKEIPCTCTLQFLIRENKLHLVVYMRSNDAYIGLPHDIYCFTMIQEIIARSISDELLIGTYQHMVGSFHLYEQNKVKIEAYLNEGFQSTTFPMPEMPKENPWRSIEQILKIESKIREGWWDINSINLNSYWLDVAKLLRIYHLSKSSKNEAINALVEINNLEFDSSVYQIYVEKVVNKLTKFNGIHNF